MPQRQQTFDFAGAGEAAESPATPDSVLAGKTVYVIDAHNLIYQVFHAMPEMSGPAGQPVAAIYGFIRDVLDLIRKKAPDYLFCAFDAGGATFRHEVFEEYKMNRDEMPHDLREQFPAIQRMLEALAVPVLRLEGYEADDLMATVAATTRDAGGNCFLVTSDKDCRQLIDEHIKMYNLRKDQTLDAAFVVHDWGIQPSQVIDFQALWGDSTDNIPGVPGIGKKTAAELLQQFHTLEGIYEHIDEIKGTKRRENLANYKPQAELSRRLVALDAEVPMEIDWSAGRVGGLNQSAVLELCREFGFRQLAEQLAGMEVAATPAPWESDYRLINDLDELKRLVKQWSRSSRVAIEIKSTSAGPRQAETIGLAVAWDTGKACYIPVRGPELANCLVAEDVLGTLKPLLENQRIQKVGQNLKRDVVALRGDGIELSGLYFDTMVADYLLDAGQRNHGLADLSKRYLNHEAKSIEELIGSGSKQRGLDRVIPEELAPYAAEEADIALRLCEVLGPKLAEQGLDQLFHDLEMPLIEVLAELEFNGIQIDVQRLQDLSRSYHRTLDELAEQIHDLAGEPFNIDSPSQLATILFDKLKLPVLKKTKTGASTDAEVLGQLAEQHPLPAKISEYRQYAKLKSTYLDALPLLVHPQTGRIHTTLKQEVAATGRLSSTDPNLQNIPIRTDAGREIRSAFRAGQPGWQLLAADYSQIELRVLAHFANDPALQRAFEEDVDIHTQVAAEVYGIDRAEVTPSMRRSAKAINFGIIYGQTPFGLAKALNISKDEAATFIEAYFSNYPGVLEFMDRVLDECRDRRFVTTAFGRRRIIQGVRDRSRRKVTQRTLPERIAINTVIQGTAADLIKQAMIQVFRQLKTEQLTSRMLLQIHDELLFETPDSEIDTLRQLVQREMTSASPLSVPLRVDMKVGPDWAACE